LACPIGAIETADWRAAGERARLRIVPLCAAHAPGHAGAPPSMKDPP
jgi:hypothetical protein